MKNILSSSVLARPMGSYLALAIGTLALSFAAMYIRWAQAPGIVTGFYRLLLSTVLLLPILFVQHRAQRRAGLKPAHWADILPPVLSGFCMAVNFALWNTSLSYTTIANASILGNVSPLWVCTAGWLLFRERLSQKFWMGLLIIFAGLLLITSGHSLSHPHLGVGDLLAASASLFSAAYILITQWGRQRLNALTYVWINGASATLWMLLITLALKYPLVGFPAQTWMIFIAAALTTQLVGYLAISYSLGRLPASVVSPTLNLQPVLTILLAIPLLNETPTLMQAAGCLLALGGVFLINRSYQHRTTPASPINIE